MKLSVEPFDTGRRIALVAGAIVLAVVAVLAIAARAQATETIYWDNYNVGTLSFANIDGTGGGELNSAGLEIEEPEGMAFDPANGRIYVASSSNDKIGWVATDGSGGGVLDTGGAPVENPRGIAVDPNNQMVYWANDEKEGSIGYASANGGSGGKLNTGGAPTEFPDKIALDTTNGRIYWVSTEEQVFYANTNGSGGGSLNVAEPERPIHWTAINVDPAAGKLYFLEEGPLEEGWIWWINTSGVGSGEIQIPAPYFYGAYGMAFDPALGRFYWANYGYNEQRENAFGTTTPAGSAGGITVATAPVDGPQDPVILKSPSGAGAPAVTQSAAALSCSQGTWSQDYPGSYVYGAPVSYSYQWLLNGAAIAGATADTYSATAAGSYSCSVTGKNVSGSATQTSAAVTVTATTISLKPKSKKAKVKAGKTAKFKIKLTNKGDLTSKSLKVCGQLNKKAKEGLKAPKCVSVKPLAFGKSANATLKVKTKKSAMGVYKLKLKVKGASAKPVTLSVKVMTKK
ncbi:MAG TPA: hypothetical protein VMH33_13215 [Solirubrobacterales bacterium]|nr:hypothetical protein [Solirubrobacterales bacterium]